MRAHQARERARAIRSTPPKRAKGTTTRLIDPYLLWRSLDDTKKLPGEYQRIEKNHE